MTALLLKEQILPLAKLPVSAQKNLKGVVRILDKTGKTYGLFLDKKAMDDLLEDIEYKSPEFWNEIDKSRQSGDVSSKDIEERLKI